MLSNGYALRGGIDIGIAIQHDHNEIYGSALLNPYVLEAKVAKSIRIVIGQELYEYINNTANAEIESNKSIDYNIKYAKLCKKLIIQDSDVEYILDYLSEEFHEFNAFLSISNSSKCFLENKYSELKKEYQFEIAKKYDTAIKYFLKKGI